MLSVASKHHLAPLLLPVAVEAAWRLQRWPLLQDLLHQARHCFAVGVGVGDVDVVLVLFVKVKVFVLFFSMPVRGWCWCWWCWCRWR